MSFLSIVPDVVAGASEDLADLGSTLRSANAAAATQTTSIAAPAADEVSAAITALLGTHAQGFHAASTKAAAFHDDFVNLLNGGTAQYHNAEVANTNNFSGNFGPLSYSFTESATGASGHVTLSTPFKPSLSFNATATNSGTALDATGTFSTPLGKVTWLSANGSATSTPDGAFSAQLVFHSPFAPSGSISASGTPISTDTTVGEILKATGSYDTPLGPVNFLTASGEATVATDGGFTAAITAHVPGSSEGLSLTGSLASGTPVITGGSISIDGITFKF
jgi:hypothetical protein